MTTLKFIEKPELLAPMSIKHQNIEWQRDYLRADCDTKAKLLWALLENDNVKREMGPQNYYDITADLKSSHHLIEEEVK